MLGMFVDMSLNSLTYITPLLTMVADCVHVCDMCDVRDIVVCAVHDMRDMCDA